MLLGLIRGRAFKAAGLALGLLLAACSGAAPAAPGDPQTPSEARFKDCADQGGDLRREGRVRAWRCVTLYADAGKPCGDTSDCLGTCQATRGDPTEGSKTTGTCAATDSVFGCRAEIVNGRSTPVRCVD